MNYLSNFIRKYRRGDKGTEEAVIFYRRALQAAKYVGILPYDWNPQTQELELSRSRVRFFIFVSQYLTCLLFEGFLIYRCISAAYFGCNVTANEKGALSYEASTYGIPALIHSVTFINRDHLHNFINRLLHYARNDFHRLPNDGRKLRKFGKFARLVSIVAITVISLKMSTVFRRQSPHLLTSLLPDVTKRNKWMLIPFALIHGYIWCNQWTSIYFAITFVMSHISVTGNALNRTKPSPQLTPERFFRAVRKLEVLQGNFNAIMRWWLWILEVVMVSICVFGISGSIRSEGSEQVRLLVVSMLALGVLLIFWSGLGGMFETSSEILAEWQKMGEPSLLFRKQMKTMRAIRVQVGWYFYVDAAMTLTLISIISEYTFAVLLAA